MILVDLRQLHYGEPRGELWHDWLYVDQIKDGNTVAVNDPNGWLPHDQSSWVR